MKLTILGNNGPFPAAGGACSGYLLTEGNIKILIDCGNGVLSNLQRFARVEDLDAVILTHLHSDHMSDMMVLRYAIQIKKGRGADIKPLKVYAPSEPAEEYERLNIADVYNLSPISEDTVLKFGNLEISFACMKHPVKCFGVSVYDGSKRFVFSGDTSWDQNIIEFSRGADFLMLDAGLLSKDKKSENVPHLTARECGIVAKEAGVSKLLLTHFWPEDDVSNHLAEAKENFENVEIAQLLKTYEV
ncbi:MBL fold metallo-hydrolase [Acetivibrio straminisolvens]|jgi:ribonuclease BN (tRNA processing enzyme)|uniref:Metal-dependent hydrolase n=1 Tax=Acetivibrio straminisolvens JCM 21531 TaxID=1294263 RepID=W4V5I3_9FIRM|nr:MBL fold metallo-hydrolase [Acetivibrio straminisolvens]GAE88014.1 metal-dependent hydrolase [Acetivibrio straminisolvens JCM 21531]